VANDSLYQDHPSDHYDHYDPDDQSEYASDAFCYAFEKTHDYYIFLVNEYTD